MVVAPEGSDYESKGILADTNTWVLVAFLIVMGIAVYAGVPRLMKSFFANRAETIRNQIDEARSMREEAQRLLADFEKRQKEAEVEAEGIIEQARKDAKLMATEARAKMEDQMARRRKAAEDRIARAEAQAITEIRGRTADLAVAAARDIISQRMEGAAQTKLIDDAINDVGKKLH